MVDYPGILYSSQAAFMLPATTTLGSTGTVYSVVCQPDMPNSIKFDLLHATSLQSWLGWALQDPTETILYKTPPEYLTQYFGGWAKRLGINIYAYLQSEKPVLPLKYLLDGVVNVAFAKELKRLRAYAWQRVAHQITLAPVPDCPFPVPHIWDIGQIFNYSYWIPWESSTEDYDYFFIPVQVKAGIEDEFQDAMEEVLDGIDDIPTIEEATVLLEWSSSRCLVGDYSKSSSVWKEAARDMHISRQPLRAKATPVLRAPDEPRAAIMLTVPQTRAVKLIEKQVTEVCRKIPGNVYGISMGKLSRAFRKAISEAIRYIERDIRKEGITKPRWILERMLRYLSERFPGKPAWKYREIFSNLTLLHNGIWQSTERGHGLGMANALTTLMQHILFRMILNRIVKDDLPMTHVVHGLFYNDDAMITFGSEHDALLFIEHDGDVLEDCGIMRAEDKTVLGHMGKFVEIYSPPSFNVKDSYSKTLILSPFAACNITHAKEMVSSLAVLLSGTQLEHLIIDLVNFWGFEFYAEEWRYPTLFGGWYSPHYKEVRLDEWTNQDLSYTQWAAARAVIAPWHYHRYRRSKADDQPFVTPLDKLGLNLKVPEDSGLFMNRTLGYIRSRMGRIQIEQQTRKYWEQLRTHRSRIFSRETEHPGILQSLIDEVRSLYPTDKVYLPPIRDIIDAPEEEYLIREEHHHVPLPNPLLSYLRWHNQSEFTQVLPWPLPVKDKGDRFLPWEFMQNACDTWEIGGLIPRITGDEVPVEYRRGNQKALAIYKHPEHVAAIWHLAGFQGFPVYSRRSGLEKLAIDWIERCQDPIRGPWACRLALHAKLTPQNILDLTEDISQLEQAIGPVLADFSLRQEHRKAALERLQTPVPRAPKWNEGTLNGEPCSFMHRQYFAWKQGVPMTLTPDLEGWFSTLAGKEDLTHLAADTAICGITGELNISGTELTALEALIYEASGGQVEQSDGRFRISIPEPAWLGDGDDADDFMGFPWDPGGEP